MTSLPSENLPTFANEIFFKFKNENKRYTIQLFQNNPSISFKEVKSKIWEMISKQAIQENEIENILDLVFYDEETLECYVDGSKEIENGHTVIIERVPWYKKALPSNEDNFPSNRQMCVMGKSIDIELNSNNTQDHAMKISHEYLNKSLYCKLCKKSDEHFEFYLTLCCGESACGLCFVNHRMWGDNFLDGFQLKEKPENRDEQFTYCPFCGKIILNSKSITPNVKINQLNKYFIQLSKEYPHTPTNDSSNPGICLISNNNSSTTIRGIVPSPNDSCPFFDNARFFIIKSFNRENIETSQLHNEWATTVANQKKLNDAFLNENVVLIFSVNKSRYFQGFALMKSSIGDKVSPIWNNECCIRLGGSFDIQWISASDVPFSMFKYFYNPLNNNEPVVKSRDTQEIPRDIAVQICKAITQQESSEVESNSKKFLFQYQNVYKLEEEVSKNREKFREKVRSRTMSRKAPNNEAHVMSRINCGNRNINGNLNFNYNFKLMKSTLGYAFPYSNEGVYNNRMNSQRGYWLPNPAYYYYYDYMRHVNQFNNSMKKSKNARKTKESESDSNDSSSFSRSRSKSSSVEN